MVYDEGTDTLRDCFGGGNGGSYALVVFGRYAAAETVEGADGGGTAASDCTVGGLEVTLGYAYDGCKLTVARPGVLGCAGLYGSYTGCVEGAGA